MLGPGVMTLFVSTSIFIWVAPTLSWASWFQNLYDYRVPSYLWCMIVLYFQWFPECARAMCLQGAELLLYPTAIGSEPHDPTST